MSRDLSKLLRPKSIAVIGGGAWCASVVEQCLKMGFDGPVWPVHPKRNDVAGVPAYPSLADLPGVPDATFIGVNRLLTLDMVRDLAAMQAGGAVCFASGFLEAAAESADGADLQDQLLAAAGEMPIIGPNCYGYINALDGALLWPDQHGCQRVDRGVAIITQSSNMAINLSMQARGLPLAYVATAGNQAQIGLAEMGQALLQDERVTALGLHIEGIGDIRALEALADQARALNKRIVALKVGRSDQAQQATVSHTASLAGSDAGAEALLNRLGIARVGNLPTLMETLKLLHFTGGLSGNRLISMSCSGGEASLMADTSLTHDVTFPPLNAPQETALRAALGPMVALANPLDYHTYIWGDADAMGRTFSAAMTGDIDMGCIITDFPRSDMCDPSGWDCVIEGASVAQKKSGKPLALVATLPENLDEATARRITEAGLIPMLGLDDTLAAVAIAARPMPGAAEPVLMPGDPQDVALVPEAEAKQALAAHGLAVPVAGRAGSVSEVGDLAEQISGAVVVKGEGVAHKSEAGLVALNLLGRAQAEQAAAAMTATSFLVEEMIPQPVAELLVGVLRDAVHGFVMTIGAGGVLTELMQDSTSLLLPVTREDLSQALDGLRINRMLQGFRGAPAADKGAIIDALLCLQDYVIEQADLLDEVEINPLMCLPDRAVAADALIRTGSAK